MRKVRESLRIDEPQDALDLRALSADLRSWPAGAMDSLDGLETKDQAAQPKAPEPMDLEIGQRIKAQRIARGKSQAELASALGVTFLQLQKYEQGTNRVSTGRLATIAETLSVPITYFYDGVTQFPKSSSRPRTQGKEMDGALALLRTAGSVRVLRAFEQMPEQARKHFLALVEEIASRRR